MVEQSLAKRLHSIVSNLMASEDEIFEIFERLSPNHDRELDDMLDDITLTNQFIPDEYHTIAQYRLAVTNYYFIEAEANEKIKGIFEKDTTLKSIRFSIGSDYYDNSIRIIINDSLPYPYEPPKEVREHILGLGFSTLFWNFEADKTKVIESGKEVEAMDEIRENEPRRYSRGSHNHTKYGYVDERFNEEQWLALKLVEPKEKPTDS